MNPQDIETLFGLLMIVLFIVIEKSKPISHNSWKPFFRLDLLGFVAIIIFGRVCRGGLEEASLWLGVQFSTCFALVQTVYAELPSVLRVFVGIVIADFCLYWAHRAMHHPLLWRMHVWHHSVEELYWFSGFRASFLHTLLFLTPQIFLIALLGLTPLEIMSALLIGIFIQFWQHANFDFSLGALDRWIMTPRYHRIHHAAHTYIDQNYATIFVVWDRIFGTYVDPEQANVQVKLGVKEKPSLFRMLVGV